MQQPLPNDANLGLLMLQLLLNDAADERLRCAAGELLLHHVASPADPTEKESKAYRHSLSKVQCRHWLMTHSGR